MYLDVSNENQISICKTHLHQGNEDNKVKKNQRDTTNEKPNMYLDISNENQYFDL